MKTTCVFGSVIFFAAASKSAFPDELYQAPKSWAEKAYPNLIYYNRLDKGGHFAAWEQPEFFVSEMRTAFKSLRPQLTASAVSADKSKAGDEH